MIRSGWRRVPAALVVAGAIWGTFVSAARANGRFPRAERLLEDPSDPNRLMLAATYGLATTRDRGKHWYYVCESAFAQQDNFVGDPLLDRAADGTLLIGVTTSLVRSVDQGCSFTRVIGEPGEGIADYTLVEGSPGKVLALHLTLVGGMVQNEVVESSDSGATWHDLGVPVPLVSVATIDVPAADPNRIYITGIGNDGGGWLVVSHDQGAHWTSRAIPHTSITEIPYIAAVDPNLPDRIFVRTDAQLDEDGGAGANDAFLTSDDQGVAWTERFRTGAKLFGFALSPDASTILLGFGDPVDPSLGVDGTATGIYRISIADWAIERLTGGSISCLAWTSSGIYACTSQEDFGYQLAFAKSIDALSDAGNLTPLFHRSDLLGPDPSCCGAGQAACAASWPTTCGFFDACGDGGASTSVIDPAVCGGEGGAMADARAPSGPAAASSDSPSGCSLAPRSLVHTGFVGRTAIVLAAIAGAIARVQTGRRRAPRKRG